MFVQEGIYDKFIGRLLEELKTWVVGDPFDPHVNQGPQVWFAASTSSTYICIDLNIIK